MKSLKTCLLFIFIGTNFCKAQDTSLLLSPAMFNKTTDEILIGTNDGWFFKQGNDTVWAKKDVDISSWEKMKPTELSVKMADKNGRVEGWFRLKIRLDDSLKSKPIGLTTGTWAATDVYLDGQWVCSQGNTGLNGETFKENRHLLLPRPIQPDLSIGKEHTIAMHVVDYVSPFPPTRLKSTDNGLSYLITLTGPDYVSNRADYYTKFLSYRIIWVTVCAVLSLLFWLLYIQNRNEKNIWLITLCVSFLTLNLFVENVISNFDDKSHQSQQLLHFAAVLFINLGGTTIALIVSNIFKGKITLSLKIFLILFLILGIISGFISSPNIVAIPHIFALMAVCVYYIVSSWKTLKSAQWAIVAGMILMLFCGFMFQLKFEGALQTSGGLLFLSGTFLSLPLGLLVYVSVRFKEIIKEVQENAQQVVQLSEEKKKYALHQQRRLEEEVKRQTAEIRTTLENLKSTQSQLIQSEKMASLGELTAGIAHEIQNPLNFVNNFSDVNGELIEELKSEKLKVKNERDEQLENELLNDIAENEKKINHHGKRADAIVKGMLQHSQASTGQKEPTDINKLADEYLRLAYHGLLAKDKTFNAILKTDFDETIGIINIVPQDIGRVLLNLYNNAFYALNEKLTTESLPTGQAGLKPKAEGKAYEPVVTVTTRRLGSLSGDGGKISISVKDNGNGIPQKIVDKIFQPFFTTKPTGQGTGLGLSLSYDMVKAHGGEIKVETIEGEGVEFIIHLPVS